MAIRAVKMAIRAQKVVLEFKYDKIKLGWLSMTILSRVSGREALQTYKDNK